MSDTDILARNHGVPKLTRERVAKLLAAIKAGQTKRFAAARAGISRETLYAWLREGAAALRADDEGKGIDERSEVLRVFFLEFEEALADRADPLLGELGTTDSGPRVNACQYLLGLVSYEEFGVKQKHEVTGRDGGAIEHKVTADDLYARIEALAAESAGVAAAVGTRADDRKAE